MRRRATSGPSRGVNRLITRALAAGSIDTGQRAIGGVRAGCQRQRRDTSAKYGSKCATLRVRGRVVLPGQFAKLLTRTGTHDDRPCGRAWTGFGAMVRVFDRGRGLAILLTRSEPRATGQVALPLGRFRRPTRPPTRVLVWQECRCPVAESPGMTNRSDDRSWPYSARSSRAPVGTWR